MNQEELMSQLKKIFHEIAPEIEFDQLDPLRSFRDQVEIDSYDFYRILVLIHQRMGVNVPDSKVSEFKNISEFINYIDLKKNFVQVGESH